MSTSKKRRAARAWMQAERARSVSERNRAEERARRDEARAWREKYELIMPPDSRRDTVYPGGKPEHLRVVVPLNSDWPEVRSLSEHYSMMRFAELRTVHIQARQQALVLPDGTKVMWWAWEVAR